MRPRRWGNVLLGFGFALALWAALTDDAGKSLWWPPVLATAFALTFMAYGVDGYCTGTAQWRFGKVDRLREPGFFWTALFLYGAVALLLAAMAVALWWAAFTA